MSVSGKRRGRHPREGERQREGGYDERETRRRGSNLFIVILFGTLRKPNARWRRDGRQSAREGGGTRRGGNPSRRDVAPRCRRSEAGGCARTVLRAVLGVFARRCSPPSSAVRKGCGWIGGRRRRQAIVVGSLARVSRLGGGCVSASRDDSRDGDVGDARRGTNLRRTLDAEHALGRECEERVRLIVPRRLPLHHRCAHRCCSRVYRLCPETRVAALFLEVRDDSEPEGGN